MQFVYKHKKTSLFLVLIFFLCLMPSSASSGMGGKFPFLKLLELDKMVHFVLYFLWVGIYFKEVFLGKNGANIFSASILIGFLVFGCFIGALIEFLQLWMQWGRSAEWGDFYADIAGLFLGAIIGLLRLQQKG